MLFIDRNRKTDTLNKSEARKWYFHLASDSQAYACECYVYRIQELEALVQECLKLYEKSGNSSNNGNNIRTAILQQIENFEYIQITSKARSV